MWIHRILTNTNSSSYNRIIYNVWTELINSMQVSQSWEANSTLKTVYKFPAFFGTSRIQEQATDSDPKPDESNLRSKAYSHKNHANIIFLCTPRSTS
jgi:hypothetical protein